VILLDQKRLKGLPEKRKRKRRESETKEMALRLCLKRDGESSEEVIPKVCRKKEGVHVSEGDYHYLQV